jgi:hypothetical protein
MCEFACLKDQNSLTLIFDRCSPEVEFQTTRTFGGLIDRFFELRRAIERSSPQNLDASTRHFQLTLETLSDEMYDVCCEISALRATCRGHLRLKAAALVYLLPDEDDLESALAKSLLVDLEKSRFDPTTRPVVARKVNA